MGILRHPLNLHPSLLGVSQHPLSLNACQRRTSLFTSIPLGLVYHQYAHATRQMHAKPKPVILQRSSTISRDVAASATINTSSLHQKTARSSTLGNSHFPLALMQQSLKLLITNLSIAFRLKYLDIVYVDITFGDCVSIGGFKYALIFVDHATRYNWTFGLKLLQMSWLHFFPFGTKPGPLQDNSIANAMKSFLAVPSNLYFTQTTLPSPPAPQDVNHPMALLNCIGKSWYICQEHISRRCKCLIRSGTTP